MDKPNPGSDEALAQGCICPVLDNAHGKGLGDGTFYINAVCPLHGKPDVTKWVLAKLLKDETPEHFIGVMQGELQDDFNIPGAITYARDWRDAYAKEYATWNTLSVLDEIEHSQLGLFTTLDIIRKRIGKEMV